MATPHGLVRGFGVFKFDLNIGQTCEFLHPADFISDCDLRNIAMLCFPDSQSTASKSSTFDCLYYFIVTITPKDPRTNSPRADVYSCYVYFRQVEDHACSRGFYQKSFVLFSKYPAICEPLLAIARSVGNKYFLGEPEGCGVEVLIDSLNDLRKLSIESFNPSSGLLSVQEPVRNSNRQRASVSIGNSSVQVSDLVYSFLDGLWHVWECIMVGLPVLVYTSGPDISCHVVLELSRLVSPFPIESNLYPYLSIFDPEFKRLSTHVPKGCIVGVTSPMAFERLCNSFSIVICVETSTENLSSFTKVCQSLYGSMWLAESITSVSSGTRDRVTSIMRNWSLVSFPESYRLVISPEVVAVRSKLILSNINDDAEFSKSINRGIIANYFKSLTRDFLIPFLNHIGSGSLFSPSAFLASISPVGFFATSLLPPEKLSKLYSQHIQTNRFHDWLIKSSQN